MKRPNLNLTRLRALSMGSIGNICARSAMVGSRYQRKINIVIRAEMYTGPMNCCYVEKKAIASKDHWYWCSMMTRHVRFSEHCKDCYCNDDTES